MDVTLEMCQTKHLLLLYYKESLDSCNSLTEETQNCLLLSQSQSQVLILFELI